MLTDYLLSDGQTFIKCSLCGYPITVKSIEQIDGDGMDTIKGVGECGSCKQVLLGEPTRFIFIYEVVNNVVKITRPISNLMDWNYCLNPVQIEIALKLMVSPEESEEPKLFVVVQKHTSGLRILKIYTRSPPAIQLSHKTKDIEIVEYPCPRMQTESFPVYIVSVGKGKSYRIIDVVTDKKKAIRIATSVSGLISTQRAGPRNPRPESIRYYKYYVNLDMEAGDSSRIIYHDCYNKNVLVDSDDIRRPFITHRRAYLREIPNRLEVSGLNRIQAEEIAKDYIDLTRKEAIDLFEYNVDYEMQLINGQWRTLQGDLV